VNRLKPSLPVFAIGAGALHAIALALLLPLLITLPGPGSAPPEPVNIEVNLGQSPEPAPVVPDLSAVKPPAEETAALPAPSEPRSAEENEDTTLAAVNPEAPADAKAEPEAAPATAEPAGKPAERLKKTKVQVKVAKPAPKAVRQAQRRTFFFRGLNGKPLFGGSPVRPRSQSPSWGALSGPP